MAGGGNFNDFYWEDQPSRIAMVDRFHAIPVRAFPQSIHMNKEERINATKASFGKHPNLQLAARDHQSWQWLEQNLGKDALAGDEGAQAIENVLLPDIAFMWGNRPDFRTETRKNVDILILARDDWEISEGKSGMDVPFGRGVVDLGGKVGNVSYEKVDWKFTHTYGIDTSMPGYLEDKHARYSERKKEDDAKKAEEERKKAEEEEQRAREGGGGENNDQGHQDEAKPEGKKEKKNKKAKRKAGRAPTPRPRLAARDFHVPENPEFAAEPEQGRSQRAWAKSTAGFEMLGGARFVITDRLHGHIMSTLIGVPHVLMDSALHKNQNFHNTWTVHCGCTRIADDFQKSLDVAKMYFESEGAREERKNEAEGSSS